jgi:hypothetical protein
MYKKINFNNTKLALLILSMLISPLSCAEDSKPVYIVNLKSQCLIGGVKNKQWLESNKLSPFTHYPDQYKVFNLSGEVTVMNATKPKAIGYPCENEFQVNFKNNKPVFATGLGHMNWNPSPRAIKKLSTDNKTYKKITREILQNAGISKPVVRLKQVLKTDVQGDGVDEVFILASHFSDGNSKKLLANIPTYAKSGDYSLVIFRQVINGKVQNDIIVSDIHSQVTSSEQQPPPNPKEFAINSILDLNGDGVLEITIDAEMHEGQWSTIYQLENNKWYDRLFCGCGL